MKKGSFEIKTIDGPKIVDGYKDDQYGTYKYIDNWWYLTELKSGLMVRSFRRLTNAKKYVDNAKVSPK